MSILSGHNISELLRKSRTKSFVPSLSFKRGTYPYFLKHADVCTLFQSLNPLLCFSMFRTWTQNKRWQRVEEEMELMRVQNDGQSLHKQNKRALRKERKERDERARLTKDLIILSDGDSNSRFPRDQPIECKSS